MKFWKVAAFLVALALGLVAMIILVPNQRWWTGAALVCLIGGILLCWIDLAKAEEARAHEEEYKDDGVLFMRFFFGAILVSLLWGLCIGAKWWTIATVILGVLFLFAGYLLAEYCGETRTTMTAKRMTSTTTT